MDVSIFNFVNASVISFSNKTVFVFVENANSWGGRWENNQIYHENRPIMNSKDFTVLKLQCDSIVLTLDNDNRNKIINSNF